MINPESDSHLDCNNNGPISKRPIVLPHQKPGRILRLRAPNNYLSAAVTGKRKSRLYIDHLCLHLEAAYVVPNNFLLFGDRQYISKSTK